MSAFGAQRAYELLADGHTMLMGMWPISTRVNKPENDDASILEPIEVGAATA